MPPLPKRKYPKARQGARRSHLSFSLPQLTECPQCHARRRPHHPCPACGNYKGREALLVREPTLEE